MSFDISENLSWNKYQKGKLDDKNLIKKDRFITVYSEFYRVFSFNIDSSIDNFKVSKACMHREIKGQNRWLFFHKFNFLL